MEDAYFDHEADIGIIGRGKTLEQSFEDAARVMFALTADLSSVLPKEKLTVEFEESDIEFALVTWLNLLIAKAYAENIILSEFHISRQGNTWKGEAKGTKWNNDIEPGIEVKGATLTMLSVKQMNQHWEARCVVDV